MARYERLGRRSFISNVGKGVFGIVVLGGAAACSDNGGGVAGTDGTTAAPAAPTSTSSAPPVTTATPTTSVSSTDAPGTTLSDGDAISVERVEVGSVSAYLLVRGREVAIVDTGNPGSDGPIAESLAAVGLAWDDVGHVILTHRHPDHIGSLGPVMNAAPEAFGYAGELDIPRINSPRPLIAVGTGDQVFGLDIISTPGHTPGHICVFDPVDRALIAGDAVNGAGSRVPGADASGIAGPNPDFTADLQQADESVAVLAALAPHAVYFGHGRPLVDGAAAALRDLAGT